MRCAFGPNGWSFVRRQSARYLIGSGAVASGCVRHISETAELKEDVMCGGIHKCTVDGVDDFHRGETVPVAKIGVAAGTQATTLTGPAVANQLVERLNRLHSKVEKADHWPPTQLEVDAYIDSLEQELLHSCEGMPEQLGRRYKWAAPIEDRPSNSLTLVWWLLAIAAGCFTYLANIILKALN